MTGETVDPERLRALYDRIAPMVESSTGVEAQRAVLDFSEPLFQDARSEAETLMLLHGHAVSDRYLYGLCSTVVDARRERWQFTWTHRVSVRNR